MMFLWWLESQTADFFPGGIWSAALCTPNTPSSTSHHIPSYAHRPSRLPSRAGPPGSLGRRNNDNNWLQFIVDCTVCIPHLICSMVAGSNRPRPGASELIHETSSKGLGVISMSSNSFIRCGRGDGQKETVVLIWSLITCWIVNSLQVSNIFLLMKDFFLQNLLKSTFQFYQ